MVRSDALRDAFVTSVTAGNLELVHAVCEGLWVDVVDDAVQAGRLSPANRAEAQVPASLSRTSCRICHNG